MMWRFLFAGLVLTAAEVLGAQAGQASKPSPAPPSTKAITLVGCVQTDKTTPERFTLSDTKTDTTYHLTGANVKAYVWRNVRIVGGLVPTANIAAQAGAIDQSKAAIAQQGANPPGTANTQTLDFRVTRVQGLSGSCTPKPDR